MINLVCLLSSLTILILSAKTFKDLQTKISDAEFLSQELKKKISETSTKTTGGIIVSDLEEDELV